VSISTPFVLLYLHHRSHYFNGYIMAGAGKALESSFCSYNFNIAYAVKFFGPSGLLAVENKPNKFRTGFFSFSAVSHVPARRAISPAANALSLRALAGCHRWQLAGAHYAQSPSVSGRCEHPVTFMSRTRSASGQSASAAVGQFPNRAFYGHVALTRAISRLSRRDPLDSHLYLE